MNVLGLLLPILQKNWKTVGAGLLVLALIGYIATLQRQVAMLSDQLRSRPQTISQEDLKALTTRFEAGMDAVITRQNQQFAETLRMVANAKGQTIIIRETGPAVRGPQGPPGAPGSPGQPGQPGQPDQSPGPKPDIPLVPAERLPALRGQATERIVTTLWPGHLTGCVTPGFEEPDALEILRDPDGRLLSGANCVKSFRDEIAFAPAPKLDIRLPYVFGAFAGISIQPQQSQAFAGLEYFNRAWDGFYRLEARCAPIWDQGAVCARQTYEIRYIQPLW